MKFLLSLAFAVSLTASAQNNNWIDIPQEAKPYTRWWWLGSAVNAQGLDYNLQEFANAGIGGVEITPIYGVMDNEAKELQFLSAPWMNMLQHTIDKGKQLGIETNMATGTGWPFGGPEVPIEQAACKAIFQSYELSIDGGQLDISCKDQKQKKEPILQALMYFVEGQRPFDITAQAKRDNNRLIVNIPKAKTDAKRLVVALYLGRTQQMVKRAAPGGEGYVIDHFDHDAVKAYLAGFDTAFLRNHTSRPKTFFNDSYEVYGADWTPSLLTEFEKRRGYKLQEFLNVFVKNDDERNDNDRRVISDYRETLAEMLLEYFTTQWTQWAHKNGATTRNQAHGSPANLIDVYAQVDIPECEGFGLSEFGIKGLRTDQGFTKKNFSDISMLKYASSAAHIAGKKFTSSETFTWLTEHFRTSLSQCKPDLDLMFVAGVNHVFFHGSCYSPKDETWPGWRFYASVDMSPNNPQWNAMPAFANYIKRTQAFLQWGKPDNDFLVYLPFYDMIYQQPGTIALFDIHSMEKRAPEFINAIQTIVKEGYDVDYISDKFLQSTHHDNGMIAMETGNLYDAIIIPDVKFMTLKTARKLLELAKNGAKVVFVGNFPEDVPGLGRVISAERQEFEQVINELKTVAVIADDYSQALTKAGGRMECMRTEDGLSCIRRSNPQGYHYFISNLQPKDVDNFIQLGVDFKDAVIYNPMDGTVGKAQVKDGKVRIQLASGQSIILRTFNQPANINQSYVYYNLTKATKIEIKDWTLSFPKAQPVPIEKTFKMKVATDWTTLDDSRLKTTMATACYSSKLKIKKNDDQRYVLDLGDVRESARIVINSKDVANLFAVPFRLDITDYIKNGNNSFDIYVTNLPANRIAQMDRDNIEWRHFKEINVVDINYKRDKYDYWDTLPAGLLSNPHLFVISH